jgi:lysine 2,3-aminomutase
MAGLTDGVFKEKLSPFLEEKLRILKRKYGAKDRRYRGLAIQYLHSPLEERETCEANRRHYEAEVHVKFQDEAITGMERLYRRNMVIDLTMICAANCRYCLRGRYPQRTLTDHELVQIAKYCGHEKNQKDLTEVLITGGDPLMIPIKLDFLVDALADYAPNIKMVRIGTRLPFHEPDKIDNRVLKVFEKHPDMKFEIGTQINHPIEFFPECVEAVESLQDMGIRFYAQNVLLKGVNDDLPTLIELYDNLRKLGIEAHYLFHCIPMQGLHHFRTSVDKGIELIQGLTSCGEISGRAKPMFAAMTDIGKITFYEGTILERDKKGNLLLQSHYLYKDRMNWNPSWKVPKNAEIDEYGFIRVKYLDGRE